MLKRLGLKDSAQTLKKIQCRGRGQWQGKRGEKGK